MGMIYVAIISNFVYQWRILQLYMLIPTGLGVIAAFIIPESLHWQWTRNNFPAIIRTYSKIARKNGDHEFLEEEKEFQREKDWRKVQEKCVQSAEGETKLNTFAVVKLIFKSPILRRHILIMALFWLSVTVTYYAITFFVPNLGGNRHTNIMMGGAVEIAGYFVLFFAMNRYGRSRVLGIFAISSAVLCSVFAITELIENIDASTRGGNYLQSDWTALELTILTSVLLYL